MPATIFDAETKAPVTPAPEDLAAGFAAGKYGFDAAAGKVLIKGEDGTLYHAAPAAAAARIASGKFTIPTADEELSRRVEKEEEAKGLAGSLGQGFESAINQATLGAEEAFARGGLTDAEKKERDLRQEQHTVARFGGGALGVGASMFVPGGGLFKGAELAGQAAAHLVVPAERLAQAGLLARTTARAADFAAQGVALSAPQALVQAAFGDPGQAAETLAWGIGTGATLGAGAELLGSGVKALGRAGAEALQGEGGMLNKFANTQALRSSGMQKAQAKKLGEKGIAELGGVLHEEGLIKPNMTREEIGQAILSRKSEVGRTIGQTIDSLDSVFSEANGYTVGKPIASEAPTAERVRRTNEEIARALRDDPTAATELAATGKLPERIAYKMDEKPAPPTAAFATSADKALDAAIKPGGMGNAIRDAFDIPAMHMEMNSAQANAIAMIARDADKLETILVNGQEIVPFEQAQQFVSDLRDQWKKSIGRAMSERGGGVKVATPLDEAKADAYQVAKTFLHSAADDVAKAADKPELVRALVEAKNRYRQLAQLEEMASNFTAQAAGNKFVSLTDQIHAGQGMASGVTGSMGAGIGAAIAGPAGAMVGHAIGKVAGIPLDFMAKKWFENKGLIYLSTVAKKAAKDGPDVFAAVMGQESQMRLDATMKGVGETVRKMALTGIEATAARTQEHMRMLLGSTVGLTPDQSYAKLENRLNTLAANPAAVAHIAGALASPFVTTAPEVAAAYQQQIANTISYLHNALPKPAAPPAPFAPQNWTPSAKEKLDFHDKAEIVANPMRAMQHVAQGTLSDAHLDALSQMYPNTYGRMQSEVLTFAAEHPEVKLPLAERASVAKFLGAPLDQLTQPGFIQSMQSTYGAPPEKPDGGGPSGKPIAAGKLKKLAGSQPTFQQTMSGSVGEGRS